MEKPGDSVPATIDSALPGLRAKTHTQPTRFEEPTHRAAGRKEVGVPCMTDGAEKARGRTATPQAQPLCQAVWSKPMGELAGGRIARRPGDFNGASPPSNPGSRW